MLSRSLSRPLLRLRPFASSLLSYPSTSSQPDPTQLAPSPRPQRASLSGGTVWGSFLGQRSRPFSSSGKDAGDGGGSWKFTRDNADDAHDLFGKPDESAATVAGLSDLGEHADGAVAGGGDPWRPETLAPEPKKGDIFQEIDEELQSKKGMDPGVRGDGDDEWKTAQGYKPWGFEEDEGKGEAFQFGGEQGGLEGLGDGGEMQNAKVEQLEQLEKEEKELLTKLKGPNRAFGDLIAASGITEEMIDSLILLKDLRGVQGLPPLREIEDMRLAKDDAPSVRYEMERKKQEEVAKARVRQVDEKGRAYGTGKRKCSIARVWIQPGDGKFIINDKQFDVYFPIIDHRADLLRPFTATKTLGLFDVNCTVKGGGVSGQVGAVRLGISKALQNFEPGLRENLRSVGFLTRDSRVVERKKPGKAKARKSFQWVKR